MNASVAHRLGRVLEKLTQQSGRLPGSRPYATAYGSWLLGRPTDDPQRRRIRTQVILTGFITLANLAGIAVAGLLVITAFPVPSVYTDAPRWLTFGVMPAYCVGALAVGSVWITSARMKDLRWAITDRQPDRTDQRNAFLAPWRVARVHLLLWGAGAVLLTVLYGAVDTEFIPRFLFPIAFTGVVVATACYLLTEFTLRPVAAKALAAGRPPVYLTSGIIGRTMSVWLLTTGVPVFGILLTAAFALTLRNLTQTQFGVAVMILAAVVLVVGFVPMWVVTWLTATPVRVVRCALERVERGDLDVNLVVFDGTELGELQRGFNTMVAGLRERERVRDLFGRHVGREVAAAAELDVPHLGGEERHVAVVFVDIVGSTRLVTSRPPAEVVTVLNRFFAVVVEEVDRHQGLVNKFEGDAALAVFGAPNHRDRPEDDALAAARRISSRLRHEVPECEAGIGVAAGLVVAGNVGAKERFEYTVIGEPVNEAARLSEFAKSIPGGLVASAATVRDTTETEGAHWRLADTVTLRGLDQPTRLAVPV